MVFMVRLTVLLGGRDEQGRRQTWCCLTEGGLLTAVAHIPYQAAAVKHDCIVVQYFFLCGLLWRRAPLHSAGLVSFGPCYCTASTGSSGSRQYGLPRAGYASLEMIVVPLRRASLTQCNTHSQCREPGAAVNVVSQGILAAHVWVLVDGMWGTKAHWAGMVVAAAVDTAALLVLRLHHLCRLAGSTPAQVTMSVELAPTAAGCLSRRWYAQVLLAKAACV